LDALDTNIEGQLQTLNEGVNNSTAISTLATISSDIKTRVNYHRMVLGDLGLGLGLVGVTIQTLQMGTNDDSTAINTLAKTSSDIETRVNDHRKALGDLGLGLGVVGVTVQTLQTCLEALDMNMEGQLQTLDETVSGNSTAISTLATSSSDIETRVNYHRMALGDLGLGLGLVGVTIQMLQTSLEALDTNTLI